LYSLWKHEGARRAILLKGRSIAVHATMGTILFTTYDVLKGPRQQGRSPNCFTTGMAALAAGGLHGALCTPLEVAALRVNTMHGTSREGFSLRVAAQQGNIRALPSLLPLSVARDGLGITAFFMCFEFGQPWIKAQLPPWVAYGTTGLHIHTVAATLLAGGLSGVAYHLFSYPLDRLLVQRIDAYESQGVSLKLCSNMRTLVAKVGIVGLLPPARLLASAVPSSAFGLLIYELLR